MVKTKKSEQQGNASIGYAGNVEIKLMRGKKVIKTIKNHNSGKLPLFSFLANSLIGQFDNGGTPRYVILGFTAVGDAEAEQVSSNAIPYSNVSLETSSTEEDTSASAVFKFLIPFSLVVTGLEVNVIRLYNQNSIGFNNHIASFVLRTPDGQLDSFESDGKSNILITWTMKITNQAE